MIKKIIFSLFILATIYSCSNKPADVFLIGDSISIEYYPFLKEDVKDFAVLTRKQDDGKALENLDVPMGANGGDSRMVLRYLKSQLEEPGFHPDYMLINCGLHDIKRITQTNEIQVPDSVYSNNLNEIFGLLKQKNIKPIWINTTPIADSIHNAITVDFKRYNADVVRCNGIADEICSAQSIPVIDLYNFTKELGDEQFRDHAHYNEETQKKQAKFIAEHLKEILK